MHLAPRVRGHQLPLYLSCCFKAYLLLVAPMPVPPPFVQTGDYFRTRGGYTSIRCKAYKVPPWRRHRPRDNYITTIAPGTYLGPVEEFGYSPWFVTIQVRGYWINVWGAEYPYSDYRYHFADRVAPDNVAQWEANGWYHIHP